MESYIDLLRNILKNFDNEFDDIIIRILNKIFDHYYNNREKYIYCIDNLYKKYDISKCNFIKKKYKLSKKEDLIFRFNRYNKKYYIIKLLKEYDIDEMFAEEVLENDIKNHKQYIAERDYNDNNFQIILNKRYCNFIPCMNRIIGNCDYCYIHSI